MANAYTVDFSDVNHPDQVADFLDRCAVQCYEADGDLTAAWQDAGAGRPWSIVGSELERAAARIRAKI